MRLINFSITATRRRLRGTVAFALIISVCFGGVLGVSQVSHAEDTTSIAGAPSKNGAIDPTRSRLSYQVEPGQVISDEYIVINSGTSAAQVTLLATDAYNASDGTFALLLTAATPKDVGTWVNFSGAPTASFTLAAGEKRVVPFAINVPADASPGDHAGGLVVSSITDGDKVKIDRRVATRLYLRVKGDIQALLTISSVDAEYAPSLNPFDGRVNMTFTISNTGNVALGGQAATVVTGLFGIPLTNTDHAEIPELLPGNSRTMTITANGVGQWIVLNPTMTVTATVDDGAIKPSTLPSAQRSAVVFAMPWTLLLILLIGGGIYVYRRWRHRRNIKLSEAWSAYLESQEAQQAAGAGADKD
jgi:hypothetical protein